MSATAAVAVAKANRRVPAPPWSRSLVRDGFRFPFTLKRYHMEARLLSRWGEEPTWEFRAGPRRGAWSALMPLAQEVADAERRYADMIGAILKPLRMGAGRSAAKDARDAAIVAAFLASKLPPRNRAAVVARRLGVTPAHVRAVVRKKRIST